jgi:hypothetical protein
MLMTGVVFIGGVILVAKSDTGEININEAIKASNEKNLAEGNVDAQVAAIPEAFRDKPNGGLVAQGADAQQVAQADAGTTTPQGAENSDTEIETAGAQER